MIAGAGEEGGPNIHSANGAQPPEYNVGFQQSKSSLCLHAAAAAQSDISGWEIYFAIVKEYGISQLAGPVFFALRYQEFFSHAVNSSRERAPLSHSAFFSLACLLQS